MTLPARRGRAVPATTPGGDGADVLLQLIATGDGAGSSTLDDPIRIGERRYRELLEALGVAVYTTDAEGRITFYNDAAATFWGRRPELGELWCGSWRLYWTDGRPMRHDECPMAIALHEDRIVRDEEAVAERPDGTRVTFVPYPTPLHDPDGNISGAVNVLVDVTERQQADEALRATAEALRVSNAVKDEFLGLVSHELRTPVTTIFGNARLLHERGERLSVVDRRSMVSDIAADSERLLMVIENLLLLTRLDSGVVPDLEPQVLGHVVRSSIDAFVRRHPTRKVTLVADPRQVIVDADRTYLELLLDNLLGNAHKYSARRTEIEVALHVENDEAEVVVCDRGIGIAPEEAERVFSAFYRAETAKRYTNGIGIGLAVCKRVVEVQRGRVFARPRDGGGAEIGFVLPIAD